MTIAVDHTRFQTTVRDVREAAAELRQVRNQTTSRVDSLLRGGWTGLAADSFAEAWSDWRQAADDVFTGLVTISDLLDSTHDDLTARDADANGSLARITTRLHSRLD